MGEPFVEAIQDALNSQGLRHEGALEFVGKLKQAPPNFRRRLLPYEVSSMLQLEQEVRSARCCGVQVSEYGIKLCALRSAAHPSSVSPRP